MPSTPTRATCASPRTTRASASRATGSDGLRSDPAPGYARLERLQGDDPPVLERTQLRLDDERLGARAHHGVGLDAHVPAGTPQAGAAPAAHRGRERVALVHAVEVLAVVLRLDAERRDETAAGEEVGVAEQLDAPVRDVERDRLARRRRHEPLDGDGLDLLGDAEVGGLVRSEQR